MLRDRLLHAAGARGFRRGGGDPRLLRRLNRLAATDPLTGLANHRHTLGQREALARGERIDPAPVILPGDIDHFKRIDDHCGQDVGDQVLVAVAAVLRASTRETDVVSRWGGEEFLMLLPATRAGEAEELAERLRRRVAALSVADRAGRAVAVTTSLGVAPLVAGETGSVWLRRADEALYEAKRTGRNRCVMAQTTIAATSTPASTTAATAVTPQA